MVLNNNYSDSTLAREYLSYKLMEEMGIETPANSYMYVTINGEEWGLYLAVEAIDETFLANHFEDATGDLYKPDGTGSDLKWISDDIADYTGLGLKTNEETSDQSSMMILLDTINNGGNLEKVIDVDQMLRYFAVNTALVNMDHYQGIMKHNFYLYEENGIFSILPWDYNMSFGGFGGGGPGGGNGSQREINIDSADEAISALYPKEGNLGSGIGMASNLMDDSNINFSITTPVSGTTLEERPLLNALLSNKEYREKYNAYLEEIAITFFTETNMTELTNQLVSLILPYVEQDPTKFTTTEQFLEGMSGENSLVSFAVSRAESILKQLSGELVVEAEASINFNIGQGGPNGGNMQGPSEWNEGMGQPPNGFGAGGFGMPPGEAGAGDREMSQPPNINGWGNEERFAPLEQQNFSEPSYYSLKNIVVTGVCTLLLIGSIWLAFSFKRRGRVK